MIDTSPAVEFPYSNHTKLPKLRYRLALDLGMMSIGWALLKLDKNNRVEAIIKTGTRIWQAPLVAGGSSIKTSAAAARTLKNQSRKRRDRFLRRQDKLVNTLVDLGFFPRDKAERKAFSTLNPYELRDKGVTEALTPPEFARALFHLHRRRGAKHERNEGGDDKLITKKAMGSLEIAMRDGGFKTVGQWLYSRHQAGLAVRARLLNPSSLKHKHYDFYINRKMVEQEFDVIWEKQSSLNSELFNPGAYFQLKNILLYQRDLKAGDVGRCSVLVNKRRASMALPSVQFFRNLQEANNLRIVSQDLTLAPLSIPQRDRILYLMQISSEISFSGVKKELSLPKCTKFNLEDVKRKKLQGNFTSTILSKDAHFGQKWHDYSLQQQDEIVSFLLSETNAAKVVNRLVTEYDLTQQQADAVEALDLPKGHSSFSTEVVNLLLPVLKSEITSVTEALSKTQLSANLESTGEILDILPYYAQPESMRRHVSFPLENPKSEQDQYGKITNPIVHVALNEVRKVVNEILSRYGHPAQVVIEVTRDLKVSEAEKSKIEIQQQKNQDNNERYIAQACDVLGLNPATISRAQRTEFARKIRLWEELNADPLKRLCPYTGRPISARQLFSGEVEVEHILPWSMTFDSSMSNLTIAFQLANNSAKSNMTPWEAFGARSLAGFDYDQILDRAKNLPKNKAKRFAPDGYEQWLKNDKGFLARALNDTSHIASIAKQYLELICPGGVWTVPGQLTATIRNTLGLNRILNNENRKSRDDHRHHAVDAIAVGLTDRSLLQKFSRANSKADTGRLRLLTEDLHALWPEKLQKQAQESISKIIVSLRPDHDYRGQIMEEIARSPKDAKVNYIPVSRTRDSLRHGVNDDGSPKAYKYFRTSSNFCGEIYAVPEKKGRWRSEVISTYQAYQIISQFGMNSGLKKLRSRHLTQSGRPLLMRLCKGDYVRFFDKGELKIMRLVRLGESGTMLFAEHFESNTSARHSDKKSLFSFTSKEPSTLIMSGAQSISVSVLGVVTVR